MKPGLIKIMIVIFGVLIMAMIEHAVGFKWNLPEWEVVGIKSGYMAIGVLIAHVQWRSAAVRKE